jgi:hypothetical protein
MIQGHYYRIRRIAARNDRHIRICDNLVNDIFQVVSGFGKFTIRISNAPHCDFM